MAISEQGVVLTTRLAVDELNAALQKSVAKKKQRRMKRRFKDAPWAYVAVGLVITLCIIAYLIIRATLLHRG